jgi:urease accessory protein
MLSTNNISADTSSIGSLLLSLQHSDAFFPSGATAFSWGLECLSQERLVVDADSLSQFIQTQLLQRWLHFDQAILSAAWHAAHGWQGDAAESAQIYHSLMQLDRIVEAMTPAASVRDGSRRLAQTLIQVHHKLGSAGAVKLHSYIASNSYAHLPHLLVTQGYLWHTLGMSEVEARAVSAHSVCSSASSAALRLGLIGHIDAQRILIRMQAIIAPALQLAAPSLDSIHSSAVIGDIASLRHGLHDAHMFAN